MKRVILGYSFIFTLGLLFLSGCYTRIASPTDYFVFRRSQKIVICPPSELVRSKGIFTFFTEYIDQNPSDSVAIEFFKNKLILHLHELGYSDINLIPKDSIESRRAKKDTSASIVLLNKLSVFESNTQETVSEPTSNTEQTVSLRSLKSEIKGTLETSRNLKKRDKQKSILAEAQQTETYTGSWEYSRTLVQAIKGVDKSWYYNYKTVPLSKDAAYTLLDEVAIATVNEIDGYVLFVNSVSLKRK